LSKAVSEIPSLPAQWLNHLFLNTLMSKLYHYVRYFASCPLISRNTWNRFVKCVSLTLASSATCDCRQR
jgi:hypothetical protein